MDSVRVAIIGCGSISEKHVTSLAELDSDVTLAAIFDIRQDRLVRFAEEVCRPLFPDVRLYGSIAELLKSDADLIVVATSSDSHAALAMQALQAGKHVLVEKPMALSIIEARKLVKEAERHGRMLAVSFQARYLDQMKSIKKATDDGRFGALGLGVVSMRWNRSMQYFKESPWRELWSKGGGLFMNQCIHYIDLLQWIMGPVQSVYAIAATVGQPINVENTGAVALKFRSGAIGLIEASTCVYPHSLSTSFGIFGEKGTVSVKGAQLDELDSWQFEGQDELPIPTPMMQGISFTPLYRDLADAIRSGRPPLVEARGTLDTLEIVLAIYQSIASGKEVGLPIEKFDMSMMAWVE